MTPLERYRRDLERGTMVEDPAQAAAVRHLQRVHDALLGDAGAGGGFLSRLLGHGDREPVRGAYLWGGVGRGKTHLMNQFHESLPADVSVRTHFHRFMRRIHRDLEQLRDRPDPLRAVAGGVAEEARVLCFDEFHVSDIADAMLLGRLLTALFERGVTLVATSNIRPADLYRDGLQRERFLGAIALIEKHTRVVHLADGMDYRLRALERAETYHTPPDEAAERSLRASFDEIAPEGVREEVDLDVEGRPIRALRCADGIAWFAFDDLCDGPRGTADYIELARWFHTVLVSNVPFLGTRDDDRAARFIHLVDEFYERNVNLLVSAAGPPSELYRGRRFAAQFQRTRSRLEEMQTRAYLAAEHLP